MIPIRLKMRNFMCYRDNVPELSFSGVHTTCICGDNGSGKSTIIDAMTWALWGRARAKSDTDLISTGQQEMEVQFDFAVGKQPYRIIRKYVRSKSRRASGHHVLEFQIASGDSCSPISGNTVAQTQEKITEALHLDYDTFVNSAYLRQGHADEFTIKRPVERKQVLAEILGLAHFDVLEDRAKSLVQQWESQMDQLDAAIQELSSEVGRRQEYEEQFRQADAGLRRLDGLAGEQAALVLRLRQHKELLEGKASHLQLLDRRIDEMGKQLSDWQEQINRHAAQTKAYEETIARRDAIEKGYGILAAARKLYEELNRKAGTLVNLKDREGQLGRAIETAKGTLLTDLRLVEKAVTDLETSVGRLPELRKALQEGLLHRNKLAEREAMLEEKRGIALDMKVRIHNVDLSQVQLRREIKEMNDKLALLRTQKDACCPLCEQELEAEHRNRIEAKYLVDHQGKADALKTAEATAVKGRKELIAIEKELRLFETDLNQGKMVVQSKISLLQREVADAETAGLKLAEEMERRSSIALRLAANDFAVAQQRSLADLRTEIADHDYDASSHERARQGLAVHEPYEELQRRLKDAERLVGQEREALLRAEGVAIRLRDGISSVSQERRSLSEEVGALPALLDALAVAEAEYQLLGEQRKLAGEVVGRAKEKLARCADLEMRKAEKDELRRRAADEAQINRELAHAFGKKGVQALLIETALPEVEIEANKLLGQMTDNRMHVKIETQRETKKGDLSETLDINISDEMGTREYEMFSGGEAFRINFAIRIALSRLLTRRAGANLPTLIIDEGFGTQDNGGIEKLKDAINTIQEDFDKILVITHIEELKDSFPTRISVVKTGEGSTISIV